MSQKIGAFFTLYKLDFICIIIYMIFKPYFINENDIPLPEYPRPQFKRDSYYSLNGEWNFTIKKANGNVQSGKIQVPYSPECDLSGVREQVKRGDLLIYNKTFNLPKNFNRGKVLINFGAVDQVCLVKVNNALVGGNQGGYNPFTFDITSFLVDGENSLTVEVIDDADSEVYGRGKQKYKNGGIWYTATSGIWQTVFIESVPQNYIKSIKLIPDFDNKTLTIKPIKSGEGNLTVSVLDGENLLYTASGNGDIVLSVDKCKEWNLENPELYKVILEYGEDRVESYFGLRKFSMVEKDGCKLFALNNKPIFHNGLLDQGYYNGGLLTPKTNNDMYEEIKAVKELGFNMIRKHIKIEPLLWYYYCDILGVLVWQDMINGGKKYITHRIILAPFINLHLNDKNYKSMGRSEKSREQYYKEAFLMQDT